MRELLLLRHGKSDWSVAVDDFDRPLKPRGQLGAARIGGWLKRNRLLPDVVVSSPAVRARETAKLCVDALGPKSERLDIHFDARLYHAESDDFEPILRALPNPAQRILLVGHNFGMEDFLLNQCSAPPARRPDGKLLTTATLARLGYPRGTVLGTPGSAQLLALIRARDLADADDYKVLK